MSGDLQASAARLSSAPARERRLAWPVRFILGRRGVSAERLEVIERVARERRSARRSGRVAPGREHGRR